MDTSLWPQGNMAGTFYFSITLLSSWSRKCDVPCNLIWTFSNLCNKLWKVLHVYQFLGWARMDILCQLFLVSWQYFSLSNPYVMSYLFLFFLWIIHISVLSLNQSWLWVWGFFTLAVIQCHFYSWHLYFWKNLCDIFACLAPAKTGIYELTLHTTTIPTSLMFTNWIWNM